MTRATPLSAVRMTFEESLFKFHKSLDFFPVDVTPGGVGMFQSSSNFSSKLFCTIEFHGATSFLSGCYVITIRWMLWGHCLAWSMSQQRGLHLCQWNTR